MNERRARAVGLVVDQEDALHVQPNDATPLSAEEREGLRLSNIVLRRELNEAEQTNILKAEAGLLGRRIDPVRESYGRSLHRKMFGDVWAWAGSYRTSDKNLGVRHAALLPNLYKSYDDTSFWLAERVFDPDEIAVRFHHGLVVVHPFANGNGRWSRLMADLLLLSLRAAAVHGGPTVADQSGRDEVGLPRGAPPGGSSRLRTAARVHAIVAPSPTCSPSSPAPAPA